MFDVGFYPFTIWLKCNTTLIRGSELLISNNTFLADGSIVAYNIRLGSIEAVWMLGVIDEIQMPMKETDRNPILVDKKKCKVCTFGWVFFYVIAINDLFSNESQSIYAADFLTFFFINMPAAP